MQIEPYIEDVAAQLRASAALGDARTQEIAAALGETAHSAIQLALMRALSAAAEEISAALFEVGAPGSPTVAAHLDGGEVAFTVATTDEPATPSPDDGDATARISLRLSEGLKGEIEQAAEQESVSVNTWLVRAARQLLNQRSSGWTASGWSPQSGGWGPGSSGGGRAGRRITGWVNG